MTRKSLQDILPLVDQPSRYLGTEINSIRKDHRKVKLRVALAFPDLYEIGTSHFGLQILYSILNGQKEIAAERVYAPGDDMEAHLRSAQLPLASLESRIPLNQFDIIGFSLLYELNYTNILTILDLAGIPFFSNQRDRTYPFIIAGGPCTCNPEPVADFFDAIVVGDGEAVILEMARVWLDWKAGSRNDKDALLKTWSQVQGVYIPSFFKPSFNNDGFQRLTPIYPEYQTVTHAVVPDLDKAPFPESPIVPYGKPVHDRLRLEVARGCSRGCRFCQAGMIYRPVRERSAETLLVQAEDSLASTGYGNLSLLSLSTGDYGCIVPLMEQLIDQGASNKIAVSLPSLRAGTLTPKLMELIKQIRKTGFTIAPEAGSQRLRNVINKNITEEDIYKTVEDAFRLGWQVVKLYFMVGLPTEAKDDLDALVGLIKDLRKIKTSNGRRGKLNVSVAVFIPKPHTPFQWASQISLPESKEIIAWVRAALNIPGVQFKWQNPEVSFLEGLWARGDRRLSRLLVDAYDKGCRFDGWSDKFRFAAWQAAIADTAIDVDFFTTRRRKWSEPLPWDHIDTKVSKAFLKSEWERSSKGELTSDCRLDGCHDCGVCDFATVEPMVFSFGSLSNDAAVERRKNRIQNPEYRHLEITYSKLGQAQYFGHLELQNIIVRAIRRSSIPVKYSEGFHPLPKISFEDPLPIGLESENELFYMTVSGTADPDEIKKRLNEHFPEGLVVTACRVAPGKPFRRKPSRLTYQVILKDGFFDKKRLESFLTSPQWIYHRQNRRGRTQTIDLRQIVSDIKLKSSKVLELALRSDIGKTVRPSEVITHLFNLPDANVKQARVVKVCTKSL